MGAGQDPHHLPGLEVAHADHAHGLAGLLLLGLLGVGVLCCPRPGCLLRPRVPEVVITY